MKQLLTAAQMQFCDRYTIEEIGIPSAVLMERAAYSCAEEARKLLPDGGSVTAVCGTGNNGGDGFACARILHLTGVKVRTVSVGDPDRRSGECARQAAICERLGIADAQVQISGEAEDSGPADDSGPAGDQEESAGCEWKRALAGADLIIDAVFGIGLTRPVTGLYADLIGAVNASSAPVLSVDIPSGIHADTGAVMGCAVNAAVTVTMQRGKPGLYLMPGALYAGEVICAEIGVVTGEERSGGTAGEEFSGVMAGAQLSEAMAGERPQFAVPEASDLAGLPARRADGNKGSFGKVLIVAGSEDMSGAAYLAARAALQCGAGMVRILTHRSNREICACLLPEALLSVYGDEEELLGLLADTLSWCDAVICGPGMGQSGRTERCVRFLAEECAKPLILDADAVNVLSGMKNLLKMRTAPTILTPHMVEMSRLSGTPVSEIKAEMPGFARTFAGEYGVTLILKDARTVTACPDGRCYINIFGNDGMATAGSGDVLAGITGALAAAEAAGEDSSRDADPGQVPLPALAVLLHALAGDEGARMRGRHALKAGDLADAVGEILKNTEERRKQF